MTTRLQISVEGGTSDRTSIELVAGTPVEPFSVGAQASWVVSGPGVMATHAYLYFDGGTLYVAAAPGTAVRVAGTDVSTDWRPLTPPCAVELGAVRLSVQTAGAPPQPHAPPPMPQQQPQQQPAAHNAKPADFDDATYDDDAPTQYQPIPPEFVDRGGQDLAATIRQPAGPELGATLPHPVQVREEPPASERTRILPPRDAPATRPAPPSVPPASGDAKTVVQPLEAFLQQHQPGQEPDTARKEIGAPLPAAGRPPEHAAAGGYGAQGAPPWGGAAYGAGPPAMGGQMGGAAQMGAPAYGAQMGGGQQLGAQGYGGAPGYGPQPGGYGGQAPGPWGMQGPGMPGMPGTPGMATPAQQYGQVMPGTGAPGAAGPEKKGPLEDAKRAWSSASVPRRIMWVLGPIIIIGAFWTVLKPKAKVRRPVPRKPAVSASATPNVAPSAKTVAPGKPSAEKPVANVPPPDDSAQQPGPGEPPPEATAGKPTDNPPAASTEEPPEPPPKGTVTKQRQAVDAVAAGDYAKAVQLYEELAAENPKNQDYKTAVEVLKKKRGAK